MLAFGGSYIVRAYSGHDCPVAPSQLMTAVLRHLQPIVSLGPILPVWYAILCFCMNIQDHESRQMTEQKAKLVCQQVTGSISAIYHHFNSRNNQVLRFTLGFQQLDSASCTIHLLKLFIRSPSYIEVLKLHEIQFQDENLNLKRVPASLSILRVLCYTTSQTHVTTAFSGGRTGDNIQVLTLELNRQPWEFSYSIIRPSGP